MEDQRVGTELDELEQDVSIRLDQLALEATLVLRELMTDAEQKSELRATIARVVIDLAYRAEVWKAKTGREGG